MNKPTIAFIGAGNMATSIIGGLVDRGYPPNHIIISDCSAERCQQLSQDLGVVIGSSNDQAASQAEVILLAVKPQIIKTVALELASQISHKPLVISVAAGVSTSSLNAWLGENSAVVRCMPNTPALVQVGATGLYANPYVSQTHKDMANDIMSAVGLTLWLEKESLVDAVTALSGSGPAYFFLFIEAMIDKGVHQGLNRPEATELAIQTALGAATLAQKSDQDVAQLRRQVTSPGGTTAEAIKAFESGGIRSLVGRAMDACKQRAQDMAREFKQ